MHGKAYELGWSTAKLLRSWLLTISSRAIVPLQPYYYSYVHVIITATCVFVPVSFQFCNLRGFSWWALPVLWRWGPYGPSTMIPAPPSAKTSSDRQTYPSQCAQGSRRTESRLCQEYETAVAEPTCGHGQFQPANGQNSKVWLVTHYPGMINNPSLGKLVGLKHCK